MFKVKDWKITPAEDSHPKELMVEVSSKCNYQCIYCFRNLMSEPEGFMDKDLFDKILEDSVSSGVE
ncbi:MAG: hypothetical protein GSR76_02160, partial [Desulfurococcales archaeon]|nr:hypothetical protein [Desulfurococcales archaeon]